MPVLSNDLSERECRLGEIIFTCLNELEAGRPPERERLLARYPEFAAELEKSWRPSC